MLVKKNSGLVRGHTINRSKKDRKKNYADGIYEKRLNYRKNMAKVSLPTTLKDVELGTVFPAKEYKEPAF